MAAYLKRTFWLVLLSFNFAVNCFAAWVPPTGIPYPPFGITNTVWDLTNQTYNFGTGAVAYPIGPNGPYTHWIDNTHPSATDTANPFGSPTTPRVNVPDALASSGNIVEMHGGPYDLGAGIWSWTPEYIGTANSITKPTYIRGGTYATRPMISGSAHKVTGNFLVFENLCFTNKGYPGVLSIAGRYSSPIQDVHSVVMRSNEFASYGENLGNGAAIGVGDTDATTVQVSNVVIFGNWIHHFGDTNQGVENDFLGVKVLGEEVSYTYILDNEMNNLGGDGVGAGSNAYEGHPIPNESRYTFIGRNNLHHNGENSIDIKVARDTVISENNCHHNHQAGLVFHYSAENAWVIGNVIHDNNNSQAIGISNTGFIDLYVGGNVFYDETSAIEGTSAAGMYVWNNTFARCSSGAYAAFGTNPLVNNIFFSNSTAINYDSATATKSYGSNNLISPIPFSVVWVSTYTSLGALQAGSSSFQNCLTNPPLFVDQTNNNFTLTNSSPAINAGMESFSLEMSNRYRAFFSAAIPASTNMGAWNGLPSEMVSSGGGESPGAGRLMRANRVQAVKVIN